jgi:plasmid replication initiation protein
MASGKDLVVQSNRVIEASYRLSLLEQRIILYAICDSREKQQGLSPDNWLTIDSKAFAKAFNLDPTNAYNQLIESAKTLFDRMITLYDNEGDVRRIETHWLAAHARVDATGEVQVLFAQNIVPFITRLETEFTAYRLDRIGGLSSAYSVRLYEFLLQYLSLGKRDIEIEQLRKVLGLEGEYAALDDLKKRIIDVSVDQINERTDLTVAYTQRRTGRFITHLLFSIKSKSAPKAVKLTDEYVEAHARPYETAFDTRQRLRAELKNGPPKPTAPPATPAPRVPQTPEERELGSRILAELVEKYKAKPE